MVGLVDISPFDSVTLREQGSGAIAATTGEVLGSQFGSALAGNLTPRLFRATERGAETAEAMPENRPPQIFRGDYVQPQPLIDAAALNEKYGIPGQLKFDQPLPDSAARDLYEHKHAELVRQDVIARRSGGVATGGAARVGTGLIAGLLDPINLAAGVVPVLGEARAASLLGRGAIEAMGAAERAGVRAVAGGVSGAAAMAALQPLEAVLSRSEHEDFTMADALRNIAFGAALGGGLHVVGGAVVDRVSGRYANPITQRIEEQAPEVRQEVLQGALAQHIEGEPVNVAPALDLADALRAEQDLGVFVRQQQRLSAETDQAIASAATAENRAARTVAQTEAAGRRLADLRTTAEATRAELEQIRSTIDTVTPERLQAIDTELAAPALTAVRRGALEAERRLLTEGAPPLDQARTEAQAQGVAADLARQQRQVARAEVALARRQPPASIAPGFEARARVLSAKQDILQATVEREIRRIAGRSGIGVPPEEVTAMAQRILAATPETARDAIWPVLGDLAERRAGVPVGGALEPVDAASITAPVVAELRQRQAAAVSEMAPKPAVVTPAEVASRQPIPSEELPVIEREIALLEEQHGMAPAAAPEGAPAPATARAAPTPTPTAEARPEAPARPPELLAADAEVEVARARAAAYERAARCIIGGG